MERIILDFNLTLEVGKQIIMNSEPGTEGLVKEGCHCLYFKNKEGKFCSYEEDGSINVEPTTDEHDPENDSFDLVMIEPELLEKLGFGK